MSSEAKITEREDEDLSCGLLLRDIEEISKALYLHKTPRKPFNSSHDHPESKSNSIPIQNLSNKDKKSSLWKWKPLKALAHIRNHRFNCCFFLHVHAVEGLPPIFDNLNLCASWKRKAEVSRTRPVRVCSGTAEFEETLVQKCTVYGSRSGPHGSAKYEPKIFSLRVSVVGPSELEIGNHYIDLSRLLPLTMEELEGDKGILGKWITSFKLTGEAEGAVLNVSFGFSVLDGKSFEPRYFVDFEDFSSVPRISIEEILSTQESELSQSVTLLYSKLDEKKMCNLMDFDQSLEREIIETGFNVIEQGIEVSTKNQIKIEKRDSQRFDSTLIETIDVAEIFEEETVFDEHVESNSKLNDNHEEHEYDNESAFEDYYEQESYVKSKSTKSLITLDDVSESIENDFLKMLTVDQSQHDNTDDYDLSFPIQGVEKNRNTVNQSSLRNRRNAKMLENLETEALMHEWGITEKAFQYSPRTNSGGFGSPVYISSEEPLKLPSIEEGVGPVVRTMDGGFLRSMNPLLFANASNGARLIVQVSAPVVLPTEMGFTVMEILRCWASGGVERMCVHVNELMPLEDVTGKTMMEVLSEGESGSNAFNRGALQRESSIDIQSEKKTNSEQIESNLVSLENLVPMAITNIEGLLIQGLKIQSGMPDREAPSSIKIKATELSRNELTKHFFPLVEWIRLDSGENFVMGLKVQLRDPLRDYEMVGPSMLALIQVDRICENEICRPLFKIPDVHLAGLNVSKQLWGSSRQRQSGSRWLFSSGMAKSNNRNLIYSCNAAVKYSNGLSRNINAWTEDVLWSMSLSNRGEAAAWDEQVALNVHVRNPDIVFT